MLDPLRLDKADAIATDTLRAVAVRSLKPVGLMVVRGGGVAGAVGVGGEAPGSDEVLAVAGIGAAGLARGESVS